MAYDLLQVLSNIPPESGVKARAVRRVIETSAFLRYMQFETRENLLSRFFIDGNLPTVDFREYNTEAPESADVADEQFSQQLQSMAALVKIDLVLSDLNTREGVSTKMRAIDRNMRSFALTQKKRIIGKSNAAKHNFGLYGWVNYFDTAANPIIIDAAVGGTTLIALGAGGVVSLLEDLRDRTIQYPTMFVSNKNIMRQVSYLAANANNVSLSARFRFEKVIVDGRPQTMAFFDDIPWVPIDKDAQNVDIMAFNELSGNSATSNNSSIFAVCVGSDNYCLVQKSNSGPMVFESIQGTKAVTNIEWPWADEMRHPRATARVRSVQSA